jgi:hypothetical protein
MTSRRGFTPGSIHSAADGLYVLAHERSRIRLLRVAAKADGRMKPAMPQHAMDGCRNCRSLPMLRLHRVSDVDLPEGTVTAVVSDPQTPGLTIVMDRRGAKTEFRYDPSAGHFISLQTKPLM